MTVLTVQRCTEQLLQMRPSWEPPRVPNRDSDCPGVCFCCSPVSTNTRAGLPDGSARCYAARLKSPEMATGG